MPYQRSLQQYCPPEFYRQAPDSWMRRLLEVSPDLPDLDRLVFRMFEPTEPDGADRGWLNNDRPIWVLFTAKPIRLVERDRAAQFDLHWSELPTEQQAGRKAVVSSYQHFMWHSQGLYVKPFLILQGEWGGTPAKYSEQEAAFLEASNLPSDPFDIGAFPACPFDERVVKQIVLRDRMLQNANRYEALAKLDTPEGMKATTDAAQLLKRETFLDTWKIMIEPTLDFMKSFMRTKEADRVLPRAPEGTGNAVGRWREHWLEHGAIIGAQPAGQRKVQMAVV